MMRKNSGATPSLPLVLIIILSLFLNLYNINFSFDYHADELKKIIFIKSGQQDFNHPLLMLQVARAGNLVFNFSRDQDIVLLGRISTAIFGTLIVLLSYLISRHTLNEKYALIVSLAVAVSPIMVIHSHYLKEDIIFTFFSMLSILFLTRLIQRKEKSHLNLILLGIATGLALSSKYIGVLLVLVYLAVPLIIQSTRNLKYYKRIFLSVIISSLIFVIINYPLIYDFDTFKKGVTFEANHALSGHFLKIYATDYFFSFHLTRSIIPGMTLLLTLLALFFLGYSIFRWKKTVWQDRILILYVLLFYFAVESSPTKPFPDFMRYVIPVIPVMIYFAYRGIQLIGSSMAPSLKVKRKNLPIKNLLVIALILLTLCIPLIETIQLDYHLDKDTRDQAKKWIESSAKEAKYEWLASTKSDIFSITILDILKERKNNVSYFVASSFTYDRFALGSTLENQNKNVYEFQKKYLMLFSRYPYKEIRPAYKSFAFSNPTIRIIDIRNNSMNSMQG